LAKRSLPALDVQRNGSIDQPELIKRRNGGCGLRAFEVGDLNGILYCLRIACGCRSVFILTGNRECKRTGDTAGRKSGQSVCAALEGPSVVVHDGLAEMITISERRARYGG